jgi:hypothetical protein
VNADHNASSPLAWCGERFGERQQEAMLDLACHAALPVALNSGLLHLIRINFFYTHRALDYTAEAELLLSPLCREVGEDLYELLPEARSELLQRLYRRYPGRIAKLSILIGYYAKSCGDWLKSETLQKSQLLTGLLHLDRTRVNALLAEQESRIRRTQALEEHEWLLAMRKEVELGESAANAQTPELFLVHRLPPARPWQHRTELSQLQAWWREHRQGLCVLTGAQGTGKTALLERFVQTFTGAQERGALASGELGELGSSPPAALLLFSFYESPDVESFFENLGAWLKLPQVS